MTPQPTSHDAGVSVVVPSYNSRRTILDCLRSLVEQESPALEIIVVDSSDDGTADLIESEFPDVELVRLEQRTHAGIGRNLGAARARGSILAFTDADCIAARDWIASIRRVHGEERETPVVAGSIDNGTPESFVGTAEWFLEFSNAFPGLEPHTVHFAATANLSLPATVFRETEGFDDSRTGQDMVFGHTLRDHGYTVRFEPSARIAHRNRTGLRHSLARQFALGEGSARIRRRIALPGAWIARWPILVPALAPWRFWRVATRVARSNRKQLPRFLAVSPIVALGITAWTAGFLRGCLARETFKSEAREGR